MNILLIDKRLQGHETIVAAIDPALAVGVVFDYFEDTFDTLKTRMRDLGIATATSIGLVQHNYRSPTFSMLAAAAEQNAASSSCIVSRVATQDPEQATWARLRDFVVWCKTEYNTAHFDMMACALYSDPDWKYVIDALATQTGITIRASTNNTGPASMGGNWFLESHTGVNLKGVYFTEAIEAYMGRLVGFLGYSAVLMTDGTIYATGANEYGQLGTGDFINRTTLAAMMLPSGKTPKILEYGLYSTVVLMTDGTVYGCGWNYDGQLGIGDTSDKPILTEMLLPQNKTAKNISCGGVHTVVLMTDGTVYATGYNYNV
jgi:hypothetical protein